MLKHKDRTKSNLYGIKGMQNVYSWQGLAIHFKNSSRVNKCDGYDSCLSDKRSRACNFSVKRQDAVYMLQSEFNVSISLAEKLIDTLIDMSVARTMRCYKGGSACFDEGMRIIVFDEDL
ncbi:hypothetical protein [Methanolobus halotolerans]|uniref:Uncharacterized protein n=1 Tax=Methanolobus halotolerans TaxID=2052935 RepID=A0A4E0Q4J0_9EURY|nr:hypothetical protein [Methanolobus halotolerans]TGC08706.1 hypothetical protein CUN85_08495 [Methanolobus halotolerans]